MTHRELPRSEWHRLDGTDLALFQHPQMARITRVLVVEDDDGKIVGHWALVNWWHAEGLGVVDGYRGNPAVWRHLIRGIQQMAADVKADVVYTGAELGDKGRDVRHLLAHVEATPIPAEAYFLSVRPRTAVLR